MRYELIEFSSGNYSGSLQISCQDLRSEVKPVSGLDKKHTNVAMKIGGVKNNVIKNDFNVLLIDCN